MLFLLSVIKDPEERSFMQNLYIEYRSIMYHTAYEVIGHHQDAEDIIHETILKLMAHIPRLQLFDSDTLCSYIVVAVRNTAISLLRKRNQNSELLFSDEALVDFLVYEEDTFDNMDYLITAEIEQMKLALSMLKQRQRDVLNMKYILDLSNEEIAKTYGLQPQSVRCVIYRAKKALIEKMKELDNE